MNLQSEENNQHHRVVIANENTKSDLTSGHFYYYHRPKHRTNQSELRFSGQSHHFAFSIIMIFLFGSSNHLLPVANATNGVHGQASSGVEICYNDKGDMVKHGEQYIPLGIDTCTQCTCMNGKAEMCISVLCSPPENCRKYHEVTNKCCEFLCLDGDMSTGPRFFNKTILTKGETKTFNSSISTSNLGLRLIASTITSFLILALLLFMIHRLRQRRLLLMIRRLQTRRLEQINGTGPGAGLPPGGTPGINDFAFRFGYFGIGGNGRGGHGGPGGGAAGGGPLGFGYGMEPPPPYTFWKPPEQFIAPGEAPPSYEETINPNGPPVQLPVCFPPGPPGVEVPPGINPQVQHLNHFNGFVQAGGHEHQSYASFPFPNINNPTHHHQGGAPGHVPQIPPHPGRVISLTNSSIANLASCLQSAVTAANNQQVPQQPTSQPVNPQANLNNPQPNTTPNLHLNRLAGQIEHHQQPDEIGQQTYTKGHHYLQPPNNSSTLVRHNSMPMNRSPQSGGRLYHHPTFHHQGSGMSPYQQQQYPTLNNNASQQTNNLAYPQRLITHLASSLNDHNQAYITSPVLTPTGPVAHQPPIIDTISSDPNYEHITVVRIGNGTSAGTVSSGPGSLGSYSSSQEGRMSRGSRIYGNGRLIGGVNNSNKTSFGGSVMRDDGISPYDSYNPRLHPRPLSAVNTPGLFEPVDNQQHPGSSTFNRTMIQTSGDGCESVLSPRTCRTLPVDARPQSAFIPRAKSNSLRDNNSNNNLQNHRGSSSTTARIETNNPSSCSSSSSSPSCHISNPISPTLSTSSLSSLLTSSTSSSSIVNNHHNHHHRSSTSEVSTPTSVSPKTSSVISSKSSSPSSSTSSSSSSSNISSSNASQSTVIRRESPKSRGATTDEDMDEDDDNTLIEDDHQTILSTYSRNSSNALRHIQKATSNSNGNKKESTMTISRL